MRLGLSLAPQTVTVPAVRRVVTLRPVRPGTPEHAVAMHAAAVEYQAWERATFGVGSVTATGHTRRLRGVALRAMLAAIARRDDGPHALSHPVARAA